MVKIIRYIQSIHNKHDLRKANKEIFKFKQIYNSHIEQFIQYYNFEDSSDFSEDSLEEDDENDS